MRMNHEPVLYSEVMKYVAPQPGEIVVDCTLGLGGHSKAFLEAIGPSGKLIGIDADEMNLTQAKSNLCKYKDQLELHHMNFREFPISNFQFPIIFADLGVSSPHFDDPSRGFSFREDGPLDMRLDRSHGRTAADLIAQISDDQLADILYQYGEIRQSRKLASALKKANPQTTYALRDACEEVFGYKTNSMLPQVFQALRIEVNDELGALKSLLDTAPTMLNAGGRLGIIAFHSLEDRLVKQHFKKLTTPDIDETTGAPIEDAPFTLVTKKAIKPTEAEIAKNPRSRSARLRVIEKKESL